MDGVELLPCPFCGGQPHLEEWDRSPDPNTYGVYCTDCGIQTWQGYHSPEEAADIWNKRPNN